MGAGKVITGMLEAGLRLDKALAEASGLSRERVKALIGEGRVTLGGKPVEQASAKSAGGDFAIEVPRPTEATATAQDIPLEVIYEDAHLIVVDKPAGMVVHPAAGNPDGTLVNALLHHCEELSGIGGIERPGIVHRLDKDTSGCLVAAKNDASHQSLVRQFSGREVTKVYLALVAGRFIRLSG